MGLFHAGSTLSNSLLVRRREYKLTRRKRTPGSDENIATRGCSPVVLQTKRSFLIHVSVADLYPIE